MGKEALLTVGTLKGNAYAVLGQLWQCHDYQRSDKDILTKTKERTL